MTAQAHGAVESLDVRCPRPAAGKFESGRAPVQHRFLEAKMKYCTDKARTPAHLRAETRRWFEHVTEEFELEQHHIRLLTLAGEAWDRCTQAREAIEEHGLTVEDRFGFPRPRPEIAVE